MQHIDEEKTNYHQLICTAVQVCPHEHENSGVNGNMRQCRLIRLEDENTG